MRASSLPRFLACPSSELPVDHPYDPGSSAAALGTAVHEALAAKVSGGDPDIVAMAQRNGVDHDDVARLYAYGCLAWRELEDRVTAPQVEIAVTGLSTSGHCDVLSVDGPDYWVVDWKSNWVERDYYDQLCGYASAVADSYGWPESGHIHTAVVWLRRLEIEVVTVTPDDVVALNDRIARAKRDVGKRYGPGEACTFCKRQLVCEARSAYLRSAADALVPLDQHVPAANFLPALYERSKALRNALNRYEAALKLALEHGPMTTPEGLMLSLDEGKRDKLIPQEAWPILTSEHDMGPDELFSCLTMSKTNVLKIIGDKAPRGRKGARRKQVLDGLRDAGAVHQITYKTVRAAKA